MGDIVHGTVKWFAKEKGYGILKAYKDNETTGDIFVHESNIIQSNDDEEHRHLNHGDAVEFLISHNGRKDRNEAQDVNRITRNQLKSKKQLEAKRKKEKEEYLRAQRKEEEERKEQWKKNQEKLDKKAEERVSQMQYTNHIEFSKSEKCYRIIQRSDGDYLPTLLYRSGHYLTCDLCAKKEHIQDKTPVIKKKSVATPILWGISSYNATVHFLIDGERQVEVDIHKIKRPNGKFGCIHEFATF